MTEATVTQALEPEYWLDAISDGLAFENWSEGKTLTVMVPDEIGCRKLVKLRFTAVHDEPTPTDLRGEPE